MIYDCFEQQEKVTLITIKCINIKFYNFLIPQLNLNSFRNIEFLNMLNQ